MPFGHGPWLLTVETCSPSNKETVKEAEDYNPEGWLFSKDSLVPPIILVKFQTVSKLYTFSWDSPSAICR